jgi:hypothetical protein
MSMLSRRTVQETFQANRVLRAQGAQAGQVVVVASVQTGALAVSVANICIVSGAASAAVVVVEQQIYVEAPKRVWARS